MTDTFLIVWVLIWTYLLAFTLGQLCEAYLRHRDSRKSARLAHEEWNRKWRE